MRIPTCAALLVWLTSQANATPTENGKYLNGKYLNGTIANQYLNSAVTSGTYANGTYFAGPAFVDKLLAGVAGPYSGPIDGVHLEGSRLVGSVYAFTGFGWAPVATDDFLHARFEAYAGETPERAVKALLRIDAMTTNPERPEIVRYRVSYDAGPHLVFNGVFYTVQDEWLPICDGDNDAIAVADRWDLGAGHHGAGGKVRDTGEITFACTSGAIGKCVDRLHYEPWIGGQVIHWEQQSYWDFTMGWVTGWFPVLRQTGDLGHEACVRMVRADYCGDGFAHTVDGTTIDVTDTLAPQINAPASQLWGFEATWGPDGASCLAAARYREGMVTTNGCICSFDGRCAIGLPGDGGDTDTIVPFSVGGCEPAGDLLSDRSSTLHSDTVLW